MSRVADQTSSALTFDIAAHGLGTPCSRAKTASLITITVMLSICSSYLSDKPQRSRRRTPPRGALGERSSVAREKGARMSDAEQLRLWREQLAREETRRTRTTTASVAMEWMACISPTTDLGLALEDVRCHRAFPAATISARRPASPRGPRAAEYRPAGSAAAHWRIELRPPGDVHKLRVLQLKLEEEIELEAAKMGGAGGTGASAGLPDAREAKMKGSPAAARLRPPQGAAAGAACERSSAKRTLLAAAAVRPRWGRRRRRDRRRPGGSESAAARVGEARTAWTRPRSRAEGEQGAARSGNARLHEAKMSAQALRRARQAPASARARSRRGRAAREAARRDVGQGSAADQPAQGASAHADAQATEQRGRRGHAGTSGGCRRGAPSRGAAYHRAGETP